MIETIYSHIILCHRKINSSIFCIVKCASVTNIYYHIIRKTWIRNNSFSIFYNPPISIIIAKSIITCIITYQITMLDIIAQIYNRITVTPRCISNFYKFIWIIAITFRFNIAIVNVFLLFISK